MAILPKADRNFKSILEYYEIVFILHVMTGKKLWEYKTQTEKIYLQDGWRVTTQRGLFRGWPGAFLTQSWLWLKVGINDFTPHSRNSGFLQVDSPWNNAKRIKSSGMGMILWHAPGIINVRCLEKWRLLCILMGQEIKESTNNLPRRKWWFQGCEGGRIQVETVDVSIICSIFWSPVTLL